MLPIAIRIRQKRRNKSGLWQILLAMRHFERKYTNYYFEMNTQINVSLSVNRHEKWPNGSQCCVTDTTLHNPIRQSVELCSHVLAWKHKLEQSHRSVSFIMVSKRRTRRVCAAAQPAWCLPAQSISCRDGGIKRRPNKTLSRDRGVLGQREGHRFGTGK